MAKFKVGDCIINIFNNKCIITSVNNDTYNYILVNDINSGGLATIIALDNSATRVNKFEINDKLILTKHKDYEIHVVNVNITMLEYRLCYKKVPDDRPWLLNTECIFSFDTVEKDCTLLIEREYECEQPKVVQCTCNSRDIFIKGCTCGAIKSYKQTWR